MKSSIKAHSIIAFKTINSILLVLILGVFITGCELTEDSKDDINDAFTPPESQEPPSDSLVDTGMCESQTYIQPQAQYLKKLDLVFVVDTSGSIREERTEIADGIESFINELPADVDYQIGVMQAHSSVSDQSGVLFSHNSPVVLKSSELTKTEIRSHLRNTMYNTDPTDYAGDGGEQMLYSLNKAITENASAIKSQGFFREDSALAVVMVSDENDICALGSYPHGVTPVYDPEKKEYPAFERDCADISPESVVQNLRTLQGDRPLLVSSIVYTGEGYIPNRGENEIGYGLIEAANVANGVVVDLASGDYDLGMRQIGSMVVKKLNLKTEFKLNTSDFDESTLEVLVDRQAVNFNYLPEINEVHLAEVDAGRENSEVYIKYCKSMYETIVISDVQFLETTTSSTIVRWKTNIPATTQVEYKNVLSGETFLTPLDTNLKVEHGAAINDLSPNTLYEIRLISMGEEGQVTTSSAYKFRTQR